MNRFSVDFFDDDIENIHHDSVEAPTIDIDYISPVDSTIEIKKTAMVQVGNYIRLSGPTVFEGIVTKVSDEEDYTQVSFKPLFCMFDVDIVFDTWQAVWESDAKRTLEEAIRRCIKAEWIDTSDTKQIKPITLHLLDTDQQTARWTLDATYTEPKQATSIADAFSEQYKIVNLLNDIIIPAFERYGIATIGVIDEKSKKLRFYIQKNYSPRVIIDVDQPMIVLNEFIPKRLNSDVNKLIVHDSENISSTKTYYLYTDGTFGTANQNRITPVVFRHVIVSRQSVTTEDSSNGSSESESKKETLAEAAEKEAQSLFNKAMFMNCVEFETELNDGLVRPYERSIGEKAYLYHNGQRISSMLTGIKYDDHVTLTYGIVRVKYVKSIAQIVAKLGGQGRTWKKVR